MIPPFDRYYTAHSIRRQLPNGWIERVLLREVSAHACARALPGEDDVAGLKWTHGWNIYRNSQSPRSSTCLSFSKFTLPPRDDSSCQITCVLPLVELFRIHFLTREVRRVSRSAKAQVTVHLMLELLAITRFEYEKAQEGTLRQAWRLATRAKVMPKCLFPRASVEGSVQLGMEDGGCPK